MLKYDLVGMLHHSDDPTVRVIHRLRERIVVLDLHWSLIVVVLRPSLPLFSRLPLPLFGFFSDFLGCHHQDLEQVRLSSWVAFGGLFHKLPGLFLGLGLLFGSAHADVPISEFRVFARF